MNRIQTVTKNLFSLTAGDALNKVVGIVVITYIARIMGPQGFGELNFTMSTVNYFVFFTDLGLMAYGIRGLAQATGHDDEKTIVNNVLGTRIVLSVTAFIFFVAFAAFFARTPTLRWLAIFYGLLIPAQALGPSWVFQGIQKMEYISGVQILQTVIYATLVFITVRTAAQIYLVPIALVAATFISILPPLIVLRRRLGSLRPSFSFKNGLGTVLKATPIGISTFLICSVNWNVSTTLLGLIVTDTNETGYFSAAFKMILVLISFAMAFQMVLYPVMASLSGSDRPKLTDIMHRVEKLLLITGIPMIAGTIVAGGPIITKVFGPKFLPSVPVLNLLIAGSILYTFNVIYFNLLVSAGYVKKNFIVNIIHAALLVGLSIPAIIYGKAVGAAAAYTVTEFVALVITLHVLRPFYRAAIIVPMVRPALASVLMVVFLRWLPAFHYSLVIALGAVSYAVFLFILRGITRDDFVVFRGLLRKG